MAKEMSDDDLSNLMDKLEALAVADTPDTEVLMGIEIAKAVGLLDK